MTKVVQMRHPCDKRRIVWATWRYIPTWGWVFIGWRTKK